MNSVTETILTAAITVTLAGAVGYGLFRLISPGNQAANPLGLGRRWFAWTAMIVSFATLPPFFRLFDANSIAKWFVALVVFGGLAFGFGWLYGRFFKFNAPGNGNSSRPRELALQATNGTKARETTPSNSYPNRSQQSLSASLPRGSPVKRLVAVSAVFIAVVAAGVVAWDYTIKATNRDLCVDLVRFIADLHDDITDDKPGKEEGLHVHAFRATEHVSSAARRLERWQSDSNERRRVVVREMELALNHYRRLAELYHNAASGNFESKEAILAEMDVKRDAGGDALMDAAGSAVLGYVNGPSPLRLSASGRRDIRETVELLFATDLARSRSDPQYKAGPDVWAVIFIHRSLK